MPRPKAARCSYKPRQAAAGAKTGAAEAAAPPEVTEASTLIRLEEDRKNAIKRGHSAVALSATLAMAQLKGLFNDRPERRPALPKFDGNYHNAARRVALLLRLGREKPAKAGKTRTNRQTDNAGDRTS